MRAATVVTLLVATSLAWAAPPPPPAFDPQKMAPYFATGAAKEAMARFRVEDWAGAAKKFDAWLVSGREDRLQAQLLAAYAWSRAGKFTEAAGRFDALAKSYPLLADYHRLYAARALLAAKKFEDAAERAGKVDPASPLDGEARIVRADALAALGKHDDAAKIYADYLAAFPKSWRESDVRFRFAVEREAAGAKGWPEARAAYRALYIHSPTETSGKKAETKLKQADAPALQLTGAERLDRGLALFDAMRNPESEAELAAALKSSTLDGKQTCVAAYSLAQSVFKARDRPRAAALFDDAIVQCSKALQAAPTDGEVADLHMKSLYQGGRCHAARGDAQIAADLFAKAEVAHPTHSYADDSRLRAAEAYDALAQKAKAVHTDGGVAATADFETKEKALLADLADKYPTGDVRSEALFRLFFREWKGQHFEDAQKWLEVALVKVPHEDGWWDAGRTLYWLGRVAQATNRSDEARDFFARCARTYPLSYYALQSLNRMRESFPDVEKKLVTELHAPAATAAELGWKFAPRPLFADPAFLRGVELARLGLGAEAKRELASVGIKAAEKGQTVDANAEELLWLAAVLYDRAGEFALSHWIPRHTLTAYSREWPTGANRKRWLLSYPRGYSDLVIESVAKTGQPASLEFAIIREESAFDPLTESFANAVGLTQLTQAPAKRFADGLPYSREALKDPAINVAIGARELGQLWSAYGKNAAFTIAGYNAGEHRVNSWLKLATANQGLDEFIESIPFDETRGYTKRVLSSWFVYQWLYPVDGEDPVPALPGVIPGKK